MPSGTITHLVFSILLKLFYLTILPIVSLIFFHIHLFVFRIMSSFSCCLFIFLVSASDTQSPTHFLLYQFSAMLAVYIYFFCHYDNDHIINKSNISPSGIYQCSNNHDSIIRISGIQYLTNSIAQTIARNIFSLSQNVNLILNYFLLLLVLNPLVLLWKDYFHWKTL